MICLKNRCVGKGHPCFITFEAGATHDGVASALALVDAAADAGADAVKFQVFDPARLESINLHLITTLQQMFPEHAVAFSDHTPGWDMDIAAVALGVDLLEKTITLDQTIAGPEHMFSLESDQMQAFISCIRQVETAMGNPRRCLTEKEKNHGLAVRRSTFLKGSVKKGDRITHDQVVFQRPGFGMSPDRFEQVSGSRAANDMAPGHMLAYQDLVTR